MMVHTPSFKGRVHRGERGFLVETSWGMTLIYIMANTQISLRLKVSGAEKKCHQSSDTPPDIFSECHQCPNTPAPPCDDVILEQPLTKKSLTCSSY